jgi:hypothetical protein
MSYANPAFLVAAWGGCNFRPNLSLVRPILSPRDNFESVMTCVRSLLGIQSAGRVF